MPARPRERASGRDTDGFTGRERERAHQAGKRCAQRRSGLARTLGSGPLMSNRAGRSGRVLVRWVSGLALLTRCPCFHEEPFLSAPLLPRELSAPPGGCGFPRDPFAWRPPLNRSDISRGVVVELCLGWACRHRCVRRRWEQKSQILQGIERGRCRCHCVCLQTSFPRVLCLVGCRIMALGNCNPNAPTSSNNLFLRPRKYYSRTFRNLGWIVVTDLRGPQSPPASPAQPQGGASAPLSPRQTLPGPPLIPSLARLRSFAR